MAPSLFIDPLFVARCLVIYFFRKELRLLLLLLLLLLLFGRSGRLAFCASYFCSPLSVCTCVCVCVCNFRFVFVCCWYIFCLFRLRCNGRRQRRPTMMKSGVWAGRSGSWRSYFSVVHDGFTSVMNDDDRDRPSRRWLSLSLSLTQTHSHTHGRRKRLAARGSRRPIRASRRQRGTKKERNGTHQRGSHRCCCCCCCCCCCSRLSFQNSRRETLRCGVCVLFLGFLGFHFDVASLFVETFLKRWSDYFSSHFSWI